MTEPENTEPKAEESTIEAPVDSSDVMEESAPVDETSTEDTSVEDASDAALRAWARDNGIEGVPGSGKLSAAWREQITAAMTADLDPKEEVSAESGDSPESSTSVETMTETTTGSSGEETSAPTEPVQPEFETGEYRSVFKAPNTFITSQTYTN